MTKETYDGILTLIQEEDALKEDAKNRYANQLADLYASDQVTAARLSKLMDVLHAIAGFKGGGEHISQGVAAYALDVDEHDDLTAKGMVVPERVACQVSYARMVVDGFVKLVAKGVLS